MAFANTVDSVGNGVLTDSIIDRSITTLADNIIDTIGASAFRGCSALKEVNLPNVKSIALAAFWQCTALETADFSACVSFANNSFYGCTNLKALILRNTAQVSTATGTPFAASAIASGTGYIYVPQALLSTYKAASGWSTYAAQIRAIEDYPGIADAYSWAGVAENIADGSYSIVYSIGDTIPLDLGSEGVVNMQIVAFDTDPLADGSGKSHISFVSKELLTTIHRMNPSYSAGTEGTGALGGWENSEMRTYLTGTIKPLIPSNVASMIKTVTKYSRSYDTSGTSVNNEVTSDDVWIPSYKEVNLSSSWSYESSAPCYSRAFPNATARIKYKVGSTSASDWWLRSVDSTSHFRIVSAVGSSNYNGAHYSHGVALGFCV